MVLVYSLLQLLLIFLWLLCLADTLRQQRPWGWMFFLLFMPPIAVPVYLVNFFVLESVGWARLDVLLSRRRRISQLMQLRHVQDTTAVHRELGELLYVTGRPLEALASLKIAMDRDPEDLRTQYLAGASLLEIDRPREAIPHLEFVVSEEPKYLYGEARLLLGRAQELAGDTDAAFDAYGRVLDNYTYPEAVVRYARMLCQRGQQQQARELLHRTVNEARGLPHFNPARDRRWLKAAREELARMGG